MRFLNKNVLFFLFIYTFFCSHELLEGNAKGNTQNYIQCLQKGIYYFNEGALQQAYRKFVSAEHIQKDAPLTYYFLAKVYIVLHAFKEAETALKKSIKLNQNFGQAQLTLGFCFLYQNKNWQARIQFQKLLQRPSPPEVLDLIQYGIFLSYLTEGDTLNEKNIADLFKDPYFSLYPGYYFSQLALALWKNSFEDSVKWFKKSTEIFPPPKYLPYALSLQRLSLTNRLFQFHYQENVPFIHFPEEKLSLRLP